jgi:opacity protein-like surface antigen
VKRAIYALLLTMIPLAALAAEPAQERAHWSLELKGGIFIPDIDNWTTYYGRRDISEFGGSLAYKLLDQIEIGVEGTYISDKGKGSAPLHGTVAGTVTYKLAPLNVFLLARGRFRDNQWLVPYAGGGWTRMYYKEEVQYQGTVRGSTDGYHWRAGLQIVLDGADTRAAGNMYKDYGIFHTSLFLETRYTRAMITDLAGSSVNLGGISYLMGLLFEF